MKLLSKYNRVNIIATIIVLLLSAVCYYFFLRTALVKELDKDLIQEEKEITDFIKENNQLPEPSNYKNEQEEFVPVNAEIIQRKFSNVNFSNLHHKNITYRQLIFPASVSGKNYKMMVRKSREETDEIVLLILQITLAVIIILLVTLFFINRFLFRKLWKPFNATLEQVKQFNLSAGNKIKPGETDIAEFKELNKAVMIMTTQVSEDYNEIKNFTENASHEIQTPLAIIKSKLELLSQSESLQEEQMNNLQTAFEATNRLSRLNQSLILLTKIDNRQFNENEKINISDLINRQLNNYEELIAAKSVSLEKETKDNFEITMNETLAEILISNLLTNAIKHNIDKGFINIKLSNKMLSLTNTGAPLATATSQLFERFKKDKVNSESLGLGLSIVKKICERYSFTIQYNYANLLHEVLITF